MSTESPHPQPTLRSPSQGGRWGRLAVPGATVVLLMVVVAVVVVPVVLTALSLPPGDSVELDATSATQQSATAWPWRLWLIALGRSAMYAIAVAIPATLLGLPAAWALRSTPARPSTLRAISAGLVFVPLLLPSYLAYAGWGLLRGPGTGLGDWLGGQAPWVNIQAGRVAAVWGLALWSWPIATVVMLPRLQRISDDTLESLAMYAPGRVSRWRALTRMQYATLLRAIALIALLTLGSAIPLHVAQVETYANELWKRLQFTGSARDMWAASWPLLAIAAAAAMALTRAIGSGRARVGGEHDADQPGEASARNPAALWIRLTAIGVWCLSVPLPALLFAHSLRQRRSLTEFWTFNAQALADSGLVAVTASAMALVICVLVWFLRADVVSRGRSLSLSLAVVTFALLFAAITPGVLVGAAYQASWLNILDGSGEGTEFVAVALAHAARFAVVPVVVGLALGSVESRDLRDARRQLSVWSLRAFWLTHLRPNWPIALGSALAVGCLSLHEIEAAVMAQPPGLDSLARSLLDYLHFARDEQLSAAALNLLGVGSVFALVSGLLLGRLLRAR